MSNYTYYLVRLGKTDAVRDSVLMDGYPPVELSLGAILGRNVSNVSKEVNPRRLDIGIQRIADGVSRECFEVKEMTREGLRVQVVPYTKNKMEFLVKNLRIAARPGTEQLLKSGDKIIFDAFCKPPLYTFSVVSSREVRELQKEKLLRSLNDPEEKSVEEELELNKQKDKNFLAKVLNKSREQQETRSSSVPKKVVIQWSNPESSDDKEEIFSNSAYSSDSTYSSGFDEMSSPSLPSSSSGHSTASTDFDLKASLPTSKYFRNDFSNYNNYDVVNQNNRLSYSEMYGTKQDRKGTHVVNEEVKVSYINDSHDNEMVKKRSRRIPDEDNVLPTPENRDLKRHKYKSKPEPQNRLVSKLPSKRTSPPTQAKESKLNDTPKKSIEESNSTTPPLSKLQTIDIISRSVEIKKRRAQSESPVKRVERHVNYSLTSNKKKQSSPVTAEIVNRNVERNKLKKRESKTPIKKVKRKLIKAKAPPKTVPPSDAVGTLTYRNTTNSGVHSNHATKLSAEKDKVHSIASYSFESENEKPNDHVSVVSNLSTEVDYHSVNATDESEIFDDISIETREMPNSVAPNHNEVLYNLEQVDVRKEKVGSKRSLVDRLNVLDSENEVDINTGTHVVELEGQDQKISIKNPLVNSDSSDVPESFSSPVSNEHIFVPTHPEVKTPDAKSAQNMALSLECIDTAVLEREILRRLKLSNTAGEKSSAKTSIDAILNRLDAENTAKEESNVKVPTLIYDDIKIERKEEIVSNPNCVNIALSAQSDAANNLKQQNLKLGIEGTTANKSPELLSYVQEQNESVQDQTHKKKLNVDLLNDDDDSSSDSDDSEDESSSSNEHNHINITEISQIGVKSPMTSAGKDTNSSYSRNGSSNSSSNSLFGSPYAKNDKIDRNKSVKTPTVIRLRDTRRNSYGSDSDSGSDKDGWKSRKKSRTKASKDRFEFLEEMYSEEDDASIVSSLCYPEQTLTGSLDLPNEEPGSFFIDASDYSEESSIPIPSAPAMKVESTTSNKSRSAESKLIPKTDKKKASIPNEEKRSTKSRELKLKTDDNDFFRELAMNVSQATGKWTKEAGENIQKMSKDIGDDMEKLMKIMAENIGKWSNEMGEKLVIISKEAGTAIVKGSKVAGEHIAKGSKIAGEHIVKGSIIAGENVITFSKETGTFIAVKSKEIGEKAGPMAKELGENIVKKSRVVGNNVVKTSKELGKNIAKTTKETDEKLRPILKDWGEKSAKFSVAAGESVRDFFSTDEEKNNLKKDDSPGATSLESNGSAEESKESKNNAPEILQRAPSGNCTFCEFSKAFNKNFQPRIASDIS